MVGSTGSQPPFLGESQKSPSVQIHSLELCCAPYSLTKSFPAVDCHLSITAPFSPPRWAVSWSTWSRSPCLTPVLLHLGFNILKFSFCSHFYNEPLTCTVSSGSWANKSVGFSYSLSSSYSWGIRHKWAHSPCWNFPPYVFMTYTSTYNSTIF